MRGWAVLAGVSLSLIGGLLSLLGPAPAYAEQSGSAVERVAVASIESGFAHSCALLAKGAVRCWGAGQNGRLGYGDTENIGDDETPASVGRVPLGGRAVALAVGGSHSCALLLAGTVRCWGVGADGRLGYGDTETIGDDETPASAGDVALGGRAVAISAGSFHTCALLGSGAVRCWGDNSYSQLGRAGTLDVGDNETPASVSAVSVGGRAVAVMAAGTHSCVILASRAVRCWGDNSYGQLGYGNTDKVGDDETPASAGDVPLGGRAAALAGGYLHTCAVLESRKLRCWGRNFHGELGLGHDDNIGDDETPASVAPVALGVGVTGVSAGDYHTCVRLASAKARCWGTGDNGVLGTGVGTSRIGDDELPTSLAPVAAGGRVAAVAAGGGHTCGLLAGGGVRCWGSGAFGRLGYGSTDNIGDDEHPTAVGAVPLGGAVRVRAKPVLAMTVSPRRDRKRPYVYRLRGELRGPFVQDSATCPGKVQVVARRAKGGKKVAGRKVALRQDCGFAATVRIAPRKLGKRRVVKLRIVATYLGNGSLQRDANTRYAYRIRR